MRYIVRAYKERHHHAKKCKRFILPSLESAIKKIEWAMEMGYKKTIIEEAEN